MEISSAMIATTTSSSMSVKQRRVREAESVSYTHLTLPTIYSV